MLLPPFDCDVGGGGMAPCTAGSGGTGCIGGGEDCIDAVSTGGRLPVAGGGRDGISSTSAGVPCSGPIDAVRRLTVCRIQFSSTRAPAMNARAGLPSPAISATPRDEPSGLFFAAITPISLKRLAAGDASATTATGPAPSSRVRSPRRPTEVATVTALEGAGVGRTNRRIPQNTMDPATRAQITNADNLAVIRRL